MKSVFHNMGLVIFAALAASSMAPLAVQSATDAFDRTVLPVREPERPAYEELDARNVVVAPPRFEMKAPASAPNVVIVLIDDMGFGVLSS